VDRFASIYQRLLARQGHRRWWPGDTPFEVVVGAVLTQNTAWTNVERAIASLKAASMLAPAAILDAPDPVLAAAIRPAGYFNVKARRLKSVVRFVAENAGGDPLTLAARDPELLREALLAVNGVGRETADSILLYAVGMPFFVVDAYTRRVFGRLGMVDPDADYDAIRHAFEAALPRDVALYNDYHAQIVEHGKDVCRKRPACDDCCLSDLCPHPGNTLPGGNG
jgi:endonuclease-3 related protein